MITFFFYPITRTINASRDTIFNEKSTINVLPARSTFIHQVNEDEPLSQYDVAGNSDVNY